MTTHGDKIRTTIRRKKVQDGMTPEQIKATRERLGWTIAEAARRCAVTTHAWRGYEKGYINMSMTVRLLFLVQELPHAAAAVEMLIEQGS